MMLEVFTSHSIYACTHIRTYIYIYIYIYIYTDIYTRAARRVARISRERVCRKETMRSEGLDRGLELRVKGLGFQM